MIQRLIDDGSPRDEIEPIVGQEAKGVSERSDEGCLQLRRALFRDRNFLSVGSRVIAEAYFRPRNPSCLR